MSSFGLGDRVEIVGEIACQFQSKIGVITAPRKNGLSPGKFTVSLADGRKFVFRESQLQITPAVFADMIFDTKVSPVPPGFRGSTESSSRQIRFVSREFDIHLQFVGSGKRESLLGQITANEVAPQTSLVTLLFKDKPFASTTTGTLGEFDFELVPHGNAMLEIVMPARRIVAPFNCAPQ
jgi:hypothetical protein